MLRASSTIAVLMLVAGCASRADTPALSDPHEYGVAVPYVTFTEHDALTAAVAALEAEGVDVSGFASAAFREGEMVAILVGMPPLRERADGSFELAPAEPTWTWERQSELAEQVLAIGPSNWDWSTDDVGTLAVGPWTMIPLGPSCSSKRRSKRSTGSDVSFVGAPRVGGLFEVQPALYLLPSKPRVEVLYVQRQQYVDMGAVDCFMTG